MINERMREIKRRRHRKKQMLKARRRESMALKGTTKRVAKKKS